MKKDEFLSSLERLLRSLEKGGTEQIPVLLRGND